MKSNKAREEFRKRRQPFEIVLFFRSILLAFCIFRLRLSKGSASTTTTTMTTTRAQIQYIQPVTHKSTRSKLSIETPKERSPQSPAARYSHSQISFVRDSNEKCVSSRVMGSLVLNILPHRHIFNSMDYEMKSMGESSKEFSDFFMSRKLCLNVEPPSAG
jgi:hypothetical protein